MSETSNNADVIVVGGGIAGLVTANRAAQAGFKPLVLEKGAEDKYLCNSRYTGGVFHIAYRDVMRSEDELYERIEEETEGRASPALAKLVARDAKRGPESERNAGRERQYRREGEYSQVQMRRCDSGQLGRHEHAHDTEQRRRERHTERRAGTRKHDALGQQLLHDSAARGAEYRPQRDFMSARDRV